MLFGIHIRRSYTSRNMLSNLTLFFIFVWLCDIQIEVVAGLCSMNGSVYKAGESWRPELIGVMSCVNCTCLPNGTIHCVDQKCPSLSCSNPKTIPGQCCSVCEVKTEDDGTESSANQPCDHYGTIYQDGEKFTSDKTGITPSQDNQCVLCHCTSGEYYCQLKTCEVPKGCTRFIKTEGDCCPKCADCEDTNTFRKNGSTWHPVVDVYGEAIKEACVICKCLNGHRNCTKIHCPPSKSLGCSRPVKVKGQCCETCPKTRKKRKNCGGGNGKNGRNRKCDKSKPSMEEVMRPSPLDLRNGGSGLNTVCTHRKAGILIYRSNYNGTLFLAFEDLAAKTVKELSWKVRKRRLSNYQVDDITSDELRKRGVNKKHLLASTSKKNYKKFKRRLDRKMKSCKRRCRVKAIINVFLNLKMRKVQYCRNQDNNRN